MKKGIFFLICIFSISFLQAQVNFNLTGAGARAAGMGGAFIGVADDATAIVWNPAGLSLLERPEASFVGRFINENYKLEWGNDWDDYDMDDINESQSHFSLNFLSGAMPFRLGEMKIVGALAFQRQIDLYSYSKYEDNDYEQITEGKGGVDTATLGLAAKLMSGLSLGFSTNFWIGKYEEAYDLNYRSDEYYDYEESYSGLNFVFGLMADLNDLNNPIPLKFGAVFRTPFELEIDYEANGDYGNGEFEDEGSTTFDMPTMLGFGTSCRLGEFFTLAADYEMRMFSEIDGIEDDLNQIRVGAEYLLVTDFAVIPLRGGWSTYPTLNYDIDENGEFDKQVTGNSFSLGSGLIFSRFAVDLAFTLTNYEVPDKYWDVTDKYSTGTLSASTIIYFE